jgi:hypothetical protein
MRSDHALNERAPRLAQLPNDCTYDCAMPSWVEPPQADADNPGTLPWMPLSCSLVAAVAHLLAG